ncbi:MAG: type II toxin-antitoxin system Phd/YefM family antitoxin, partial [Gammaproteobacteria bacterium]|nr:type II toxin-antitoxin system Phd/YefM family antitoxin [Gammaproteobacteria bacterium]MYG95977.1 type II toxin-antitoxin system Phd/YefM family antitoxin [Gammaproteobacteria bacterium]
MKQVQLHKAKADLSALVECAALGETLVITRRSQPRAVIVSYARIWCMGGLSRAAVL